MCAYGSKLLHVYVSKFVHACERVCGEGEGMYTLLHDKNHICFDIYVCVCVCACVLVCVCVCVCERETERERMREREIERETERKKEREREREWG